VATDMLAALVHAWASWKRAPGVALLAVIAFAIGIGSATAIFTVINGVLLRPLPYPNSERFVALSAAKTTEPGISLAMSVPELHDYEQQATSFDAFGWFRTGTFHLTAPGEPQLVRGATVTPDLARQLGSPLLGQWFPDESSAVLSDTLWRRLGARPDIIGAAITLDDRVYTVSGVMPPAFRLPIASLGMGRGNTEVWIPLDPSPPDATRGSGQYFAYARRKPGVSLAQAEMDVKRIAAIVAATDPARYQFYTANVVGLRESTADLVRAPLLILLGSAGLLLLIACANVATLLLARSVVRARETAIRVALGASGRQLALSYFAEGALVSVAGAAAGVGLSAIFVRQIVTAASEFITRADLIAIDWKVLEFSVAMAIATGVLAGLAPLWQAIRTAPNAALTEGVRASDDVRHSGRSLAQPGPRAFGLRPRRHRHVQPHVAAESGGECPAGRMGSVDGCAAADTRRDGCRVREPVAEDRLRRHRDLHGRQAAGRPRAAGVPGHHHAGFPVDDADPAARRPIPQRVRQPARSADRRRQRGCGARVLAWPRSDRCVGTPQPTGRRPVHDRRRRRRRPQQWIEQARSA